MARWHFSNQSSIEKAVVEFSSYCRSHDLSVGISHTKEALELSRSGFIYDRNTFKYALRSLFCQAPSQYPVFNHAFETYWSNTNSHVESRVSKKNRTNIQKQSKGSVVMLGFGESNESKEDEAKNTSGANAVQALKKTDFSKLSEMESRELEEIADKLFQQLNLKLKRRYRVEKKGLPDIRKTIRQNIRNGGNFLDLVKKNKRKEKLKLIVMLDVSGSMDKYSFYLLKFIWSLKTNFDRIETFIFSTSLIRITDMIDEKQMESALHTLSAQVNNWSSGTKIGECIQSFNEKYAYDAMHGRNITIILSDGLDTGEPELLSDELKKLKLRTKKLIWLNPLKGHQDYQPLAKGMKAAMPEIDSFSSAHSLDSLLELEKILENVN